MKVINVCDPEHMIFDIQRFSTHDGHGIRTNIFFKGCPLRCLWCSNPESQSFSPEILFDERRCMGFGDCTKTGDGAFFFKNDHVMINRKALANPTLYDDLCPSKALMVTGEKKQVGDILEQINKDLEFYRQSDGGITLTGGEPFAQDIWIHDLIREIKNKDIHISVETCLHVPWKRIEPNLSYIDEFLIDLKHIDGQKFKKYTGGNINLVLNNLIVLDDLAVDYILRIPVIPTFNHTLDDMKEIINFAATLKNGKKIDFIPYHTLGEFKYHMLNKPYPFAGIGSIPEEELDPYIKFAQNKGFKVNIGG